MKPINIDQMPEGQIRRLINERQRAEEFLNQPMASTYLVRSRAWKSIGFRPEKLLDWRSLERRGHQLRTVTSQIRETWWTAVETLRKEGIEAGSDGTAWLPSEDGQHVDVFSGGWSSTRTFAEVFKHGLSKPDAKAVVITGKAATAIRRLQEREETWRRRTGAYFLAFRISVEERISAFVQQNERTRSVRHVECNPCVFFFENDDRSYVIATDQHGNPSWLDGSVYVDRGP